MALNPNLSLSHSCAGLWPMRHLLRLHPVVDHVEEEVKRPLVLAVPAGRAEPALAIRAPKTVINIWAPRNMLCRNCEKYVPQYVCAAIAAQQDCGTYCGTYFSQIRTDNISWAPETKRLFLGPRIPRAGAARHAELRLASLERDRRCESRPRPDPAAQRGGRPLGSRRLYVINLYNSHHI